MGGRFDWAFAPRMRFVVVPKILLAGNSISNRAVSSTGGTTTADERSTLDEFSWLGSVDTSVAWDVSDRWSLWIGYRVVGVGNIAQADGQWPAPFRPRRPASAAWLPAQNRSSTAASRGLRAGTSFTAARPSRPSQPWSPRAGMRLPATRAAVASCDRGGFTVARPSRPSQP